MRHKHPLNSNTPDQTAARIFEHRLKDHVQQNPACQWELDWYKSLKKATRRNRPLIDQQLANQAATGKPLCNLLISELAKPAQAFELQSPISPALTDVSDHGQGAASSSTGYFPIAAASEGPSGLSSGAESSNEEHGEKVGLEEPKTPTSADIGSPTIPETQSSKLDNVVLSSPFDDAGKPRARTSKFPGAYLASVTSLDSGVSSENTGSLTPDTAASPIHLPLSIDDAPPTLHFVPPSPTSGSGGAHQPELPQQSDVSPDPGPGFNSEEFPQSGRGLRLAELQTHANSSEPSSAVSQQVPGAYRASLDSLDVASSAEDVIESPSSQRTATEVDWNVPDQVNDTQDAHISSDADSIKSDDTIGSPARPPTDTFGSQAGATHESDVSQIALVPEAGDLDPQTNSAPLEKGESSQPDEVPEPSAQDVRAPELDAPATSRDSAPHDINDVPLANPATSQSVTSESAPRVEPEPESVHPSDSPQPDAEIPHTSENDPPDLPTTQLEASTQETDGDVSLANPGPPATKTIEDLEPVRHAEPRTEPPAIAVPGPEIAPGPDNQTSPEVAAEAPTHETGDGAPRTHSDPLASGPTESAPEQPLPNAPQPTDLLGSDTAIAPEPGNPPPPSLDDLPSGTDTILSRPDFTTPESESVLDPKPYADPQQSRPSETSELAAQVVQQPETSLGASPSISQDLSTLKPDEDQTNPETVENVSPKFCT
ncbi:hypothetical protein BDV93DRAFT_492276 [Ceratobasidium sp. AG-I]|nr:hypothetical protein BDV93DRAFT_492276 [Ceratobasidium sp. AG-I]